ncbi:MAG: galactokinase [Chloroflexota bacterium]|nr:galactokinase [Chloroflexota bacterium]
MKNNVTSAFQTHFNRPPEIVVRAPGRVNLLGGHTDYNAGYVLPVAVNRAAWIAAAPINARKARVYALDLEDEATFTLTPVPRAEGNWADYVRGVAWALQERGLETVGLEAVLTSNIPVGAGLSSSAAVEVAFAYVWQQLAGFKLTRRELALACQWAENDYVGVNCGILDQMASSCGVEGHALLLDCRTLETALVPLPEGVAIVVADTGVRRQLASSEYNVRRAQCERAVEILGQRLPGVRALRDVSADDLGCLKGHLPGVVYRRARHVVSDNARVLQATEALRKGDVATVGALMKACHVSLRDDYEVSAPELDALASAAWEVEGCYGARLTGAGFGGCIVALVTESGIQDFKAHVSAAYETAFGRQPDIYVCRSTTGVRAIPHV